MKKHEQTEAAFLKVLHDGADAGQPDFYSLQIAVRAREVELPLTRGQAVGSTVLNLLGKQFRPSYAGRLYPTLRDLEIEGLVESELESLPEGDTRLPRRLYRLADQPQAESK